MRMTSLMAALCCCTLTAAELVVTPELGAIAARHGVFLWRHTPTDYVTQLRGAMTPLMGTEPRLTCSRGCVGKRCHTQSLLQWARGELPPPPRHAPLCPPAAAAIRGVGRVVNEARASDSLRGPIKKEAAVR